MNTKATRDESSLDSILKSIGENLSELRLKKGYKSQADFAADHKLSRIQYWRMEKGKANITFGSLNKVIAIHNLSMHEFLNSVISASQRRSES